MRMNANLPCRLIRTVMVAQKFHEMVEKKRFLVYRLRPISCMIVACFQKSQPRFALPCNDLFQNVVDERDTYRTRVILRRAKTLSQRSIQKFHPIYAAFRHRAQIWTENLSPLSIADVSGFLQRELPFHTRLFIVSDPVVLFSVPNPVVLFSVQAQAWFSIPIASTEYSPCNAIWWLQTSRTS